MISFVPEFSWEFIVVCLVARFAETERKVSRYTAPPRQKDNGRMFYQRLTPYMKYNFHFFVPS